MNNSVGQFVIPLGTTLFISIILLVLRYLIYRHLHKWAAGTTTKWDEVIVRSTRLVSLFWCLWLGIFSGLQFVKSIPWVSGKLIPVVFIVLGAYALVALILLGIKWYIVVIASQTLSKLDDVLMNCLKIGLPAIIGFLGIIFVADIFGINVGLIKEWLAQHWLSLSLILVFGIGALLIVTALIPRFVHTSVARLKMEETEDELKKRSETLVSVLTVVIQVTIIIVIFLMIISELGKNIWTILAGLSVIGVAVGFGAQSLIKDIIAGLFVIFENQYRKGDVAKLADVTGLVEDINLRRTVLRDMDGIVHMIPNGEIRVASNFTKIWSRVNINISVAYATDLDHAIAVINKVGKELAEDPNWSSAILTPPKFLRVDNFGDSGIELKILGETKPIRQWDVMGELRLRLKREFDKEGIEIPWPHTKVYFGNNPPIPPGK